MGDLEATEMESGVSAFTGEPFCTIRCTGTVNGKSVVLRGQLSPDEIRQHALRFLEVAEAAESDHAVRAVFSQVGLPDETWAHFITLLRKFRDDHQPKP